MTSRTVLFIFLVCTATACELNNSPKKEKEMSYSYACLDSTLSGSRLNKGLDKAGDLIRDLAVDESAITDQVQNEYGAAFHQDAVQSGTFKLLKDGKIESDLKTVLSELLAAREQPSAIQYQIYALNDTAINAFTFGGRIYVTQKMYEKCKDKTALLYSIVGHEIGHSEKGHIKRTIQEMILSNRVFGERNGATVLQIKKLLTGSFNQKNELEADYYGTDLSYKLDQDICAAVSFWKEMSQQENQYSQLEDFFRSHPFSNLRAQCLEAHILTNFGKDCND
ncbi:MAG TPA: M48 family metallopeptidase [Flavisolibacter sp.]|nr:M48 family metallopeptidase [Flavisolibacter sp.]